MLRPCVKDRCSHTNFVSSCPVFALLSPRVSELQHIVKVEICDLIIFKGLNRNRKKKM